MRSFTLFLPAAIGLALATGAASAGGDFDPCAWEPAIGQSVGLVGCDDCVTDLPNLSFSFPFLGGSYTEVFVDENGALGLGAPGEEVSYNDDDYENEEVLAIGFPVILPFWTDLDLTSMGTIYSNDLGDRLVVTWIETGSNQNETTPFTFQVQLLADGRIIFAYDGISPLSTDNLDVDVVVGLSIAQGAADPGPSGLSSAPFTVIGDTVYEIFEYDGDTFDLDHRVLIFTPLAAAQGFDVTTCPLTGAGSATDRVSGTEKGSALIYSKVEIRWDDQGNVIQDTFIDLTNDLGQDVSVNMYFVNGDPPLAATPTERAHPGWNWVDVKRELTANQPAYWSALTGGPGPGSSPVAPFTILDPSADPLTQGRPATDGSGDRVLRGYIVAFAVDADCCQISHNHLKGDATLVNYRDSYAWEYNAWAFQATVNDPGATFGACGTLDFDGIGYVQPFSLLLLDFYAPGSDALGGVAETDLTLHPVDADLRQETAGPVGTKASFIIWNEDETQFTNLHRCITCWDQQLLSLYTEGGVQNHFLSLQTDKGKARIDGIASILCSSNCCLDRGSAPGCADNTCQEQVCAVDPFCCNSEWDADCAAFAVSLCDACDSLQADTPLLGVAARFVSFGSTHAASGVNLIGMGVESARLDYDPAGGGDGGGNPPTATGGHGAGAVEAMLEQMLTPAPATRSDR